MPDARAEATQPAPAAPMRSLLKRVRVHPLVFAAVCVALLITWGANAVMVANNRMMQSTNQLLLDQRPPAWLQYAAVDTQVFDYEQVYICSAGQDPVTIKTSELRACPDYTARVEFHGNRPETPPTLHPAHNAKGQMVIGLKARWVPQGCPEDVRIRCITARWIIEPVFADSVIGFAYNAYLNGQLASEPRRDYVGPQFFTPNHPEYGATSALSNGLEIYAADVDPAVISPPLTNEQLGD